MPQPLREAKPQPLIECPHCHGTGLDHARVLQYAAGRVVLTDAERVDALRCPTCNGTGQLAPARALALGLPIS